MTSSTGDKNAVNIINEATREKNSHDNVSGFLKLLGEKTLNQPE